MIRYSRRVGKDGGKLGSIAAALGAALMLSAGPLLAQGTRAPGPLSADALDKLVPKHPGYLGALAPDQSQKAPAQATFRRDRHLVRRSQPGLQQVHVRAALSQVPAAGAEGL